MKYFYECDEHGVFEDAGEVRQHRPCPRCNGRCWLVSGGEVTEESPAREKKLRRKKINAQVEGK
jgi:hypothetical protein